MTRLDTAHERLVRRTIQTPAARKLGLSFLAVASDEVCIALKFDEANCTEASVVHGGIIATLIDIAGVAVAIAGARTMPQSGGTSQLSVNYLAPAFSCDLEACAVLLRGGGRSNVARVSVTDAVGKLLAEGHVSVTLK